MGFTVTALVSRVRSKTVRATMLWRCLVWCGTCVAVGATVAVEPPTETAIDDGVVAETARATSSLPAILEPHVQEALSRWEDDIASLEAAADAREPDPQTVLVVGSSSVRLWADHIHRDLAPFVVDRRGYGGASYIDVAIFADRLLRDQPYRALVLFAGNDVRGRDDDHTPQEVTAAIDHIVEISRRHQPFAPVLVVEVTPTPKREHLLEKTLRINTALREHALLTPHVYFLPTWSHYTLADGSVNARYFGDDRLHQSREGYELWSRLIRDRLAEVLRSEALFRMRDSAGTHASHE